MSMDLKSLALPGVQHLQPYQGGKPLDELERELGISGAIKLASNENPLGLSKLAKAAVEASLEHGARYPDGSGFYLKRRLAEKLAVSVSQLTLGNGSNEVLELLARGFLGPQHNAIIAEHAFVVYQLVITAQNATTIVVPASNWGHDLPAMAAAVNEHTRLLFIANPNNPTGTSVSLASIERLLQKLPESVLVVVDEAYYEYVDQPDYGSALVLIDRYPNLIVTRTFSKAYGLGALRIGYSVSHPDVADILNRLRQPFNVNSPALAAALAVLDDDEYLQRSISVNRDGYDQLVAGFEALGLAYIPSAGNFVAVQVPGDSLALYEALLRKGVIVRPIALYGMPQHLRVSIGLPHENQRFLDTLSQLLADGDAA
ncbi:histidinol-phosphate transaminase [Porticoccus sp.]|uniref:histidinol-phosphate transaminase n=1 Tax=Porticoccus sp. TaxID=2024853 RepID=UPI003F699446